MRAPRDEVRAGAGLRLLRAAVFAAACVALAAAGHALASCAAVPLASLLAGFVLVFLVAAALAGHRRSLPGIAALLAAGQLALHSLFGAGQHAAAAMSGGSGGSGGGPADEAGRSLAAQAAQLLCGVPASAIGPERAREVLTRAGIDPGPAAHHHGSAAETASGTGEAWQTLLPSPAMTLAHLLAALVAAWLLRHGELALFRLVALSTHGAVEVALMRSLRSALLAVLGLGAGRHGTPVPVPGACRRTGEDVPEPCGIHLQHAVVRRGPPAAPAFVLAA
ncbi:hypothetical protein HUT18_17350 [Streptomyces sp. NA04227]|uniref:hypothetical protein n=1 Tax=Streptomyces sp. NA04227 TaxID=2742136 RepID=UPI001592AB81|nr:hypothetical protein [Streptomyces sp. NA04227]QKW07891.1 hypothetical protein HUT18_17350 [Streptomyces sp. NA04227]